MEGLGGGLHTCVARIDQGPSVLKHKYHRHLNHEGPEGGFGGSRQLSPFGGGLARGLYQPPPPPPPSNCKPSLQAPPTLANCRKPPNVPTANMIAILTTPQQLLQNSQEATIFNDAYSYNTS